MNPLRNYQALKERKRMNNLLDRFGVSLQSTLVTLSILALVGVLAVTGNLSDQMELALVALAGVGLGNLGTRLGIPTGGDKPPIHLESNNSELALMNRMEAYVDDSVYGLRTRMEDLEDALPPHDEYPLTDTTVPFKEVDLEEYRIVKAGDEPDSRERGIGHYSDAEAALIFKDWPDSFKREVKQKLDELFPETHNPEETE